MIWCESCGVSFENGSDGGFANMNAHAREHLEMEANLRRNLLPVDRVGPLRFRQSPPLSIIDALREEKP